MVSLIGIITSFSWYLRSGGGWIVQRRGASEVSGLFPDPEAAYTMSEEYKRDQERKQQAELDRLTGVDGVDDDAE